MFLMNNSTYYNLWKILMFYINFILLIQALIKNIKCENKSGVDLSLHLNQINKGEKINCSLTRSLNNATETTILSDSPDFSKYNILEFNIQEYCNQLWSYQNQIKQEISRIVNLHKEFISFLLKNDIRNDSSFEDIFKRSSETSKKYTAYEISDKFDEYCKLASEYNFLSNSENGLLDVLISDKSSFYSILKDFLLLKSEFAKFNFNIETCMNNRKNIVNQGLNGINTLIFIANIFVDSMESMESGDIIYLKKTSTKVKNLDSNFNFIKTLKKLRIMCNKGINQNNEVSRRKQLKWLKKKDGSIKKTLSSLETIIRINLKKIKNLTNCISHFQNKKTIIDTTSGVVNSTGNIIIDYSVNRRNIITTISAKYTYTTLNSYILNNKSFSLWLFIQRRVTNIQIALFAIKESRELSNKINSFLSFDELLDILSKCSEVLRKTASNWDIFFSEKNNAIIKSIQKETLNRINRFTSKENHPHLKSEWEWFSNDIEELINYGKQSFEEIFNDIIYYPLSNCAKKLSPIYKKLVSEFKPDRNIEEKIQKKIMKDYKNLFNEALNKLSKQKKSFTSLKYSFLWPHNNATLTSALSIYENTQELVNSINPQDESFLYKRSNYSEQLLIQQLAISEGFFTLYKNIKIRFGWDLSLFQNDFGYFRNISPRIENEDAIEIAKIKIPNDMPVKIGEWFYGILEFLSLNDYKFSKINKIVEPATKFRVQFVEQWCEIIMKIVLKIVNPTALIVNKMSEEAFSFYLNEQISKSKEFSHAFEDKVSISNYIDSVDNSLTSLNKESFISKFETINIANQDEYYRSEDEFPSISALKEYLSDLKEKIDDFCNIKNNKKKGENIVISRKLLCEDISIVFLNVNKNMKEISSDLQKVYSDLNSQETDIKKLDSVVQSCISIEDKIKRVECWIPNQSLELPLRRALQIRRVMTNWVRENIRTYIVQFTNFIEECLKIGINDSFLLNSDNRESDSKLITEENAELNETIPILINLVSEMRSHIADELNNIETIYMKYYQDQINEISKSYKTMIYNYVKLNSMKTTLIHNYGKPNIFQRIFRFPKTILSVDDVSNLENSTMIYRTFVNNNATYAMDLCDYIKNNIVSSNNHTLILNKFLRTISALNNKLHEISLIISKGSPSDYNLLDDIELSKYKNIQEKTLTILGHSDKYLKLVNVENFRYFTIRNITENVVNSILELSNEIEQSEQELERREEMIANTNCYRRFIWKRRIKKRRKKKLNDKQIEKMFKVDKSQKISRKLLEKKHEVNGKLKFILTKTVGIEDFTPNDNNQVDMYEDHSSIDKSEYDDLESFQFDDLYKFDKRSNTINSNNDLEKEVDYDLDTGGHTKIEKNTNPIISKLSDVIHITTSINNSIQQYKEIKAKIKEGGVDASSENSGVNLMTGFNILNALAGNSISDLDTMFGSINDQSNVFNEADILSELQKGERPVGLNKEIKSIKNEELNISYQDFKLKVENELKNSGLDLDLQFDED